MWKCDHHEVTMIAFKNPAHKARFQARGQERSGWEGQGTLLLVLLWVLELCHGSAGSAGRPRFAPGSVAGTCSFAVPQEGKSKQTALLLGSRGRLSGRLG